MGELSLFVGKGGVGKTTVSSAYAVHSAAQDGKRRVLLISSDPAHSLADLFALRLGDRPKAIALPGRRRLYLWQVNAEKEFRAFVGKYKEALLATVESGTIFSRQEIEPLLDTALPGLAEISALLAMEQALSSGRYDHIVLDTAPFGHTLRLLQLPEQFARFLDFLEMAGSRDQILAAHFGGKAGSAPQRFLREWRRIVEGVRQAIARDARLFLVTTPEKFAVNESLRVTAALRSGSLAVEVSAVVLNRAVPRAGKCAVCRRRAAMTRAARAVLGKHFSSCPLLVGEDWGAPVLGAQALYAFAQQVFLGKHVPAPETTPPPAPELGLRAIAWPGLDTKLTLVLGKGGVGKTTVSAGLGFRSRSAHPRQGVTICSVDPAPSLDDIFQQEVTNQPQPVLGDRRFTAAEMDSAAEFAAWVRGIKDKIDRALSGEQSGVHVELSFERRLFTALLDIVPPGVDEVFAVFRILDLLAAGAQKVVIDLAPTGHALELLRMPQRMQQWSRLLLKTLAAHRTLALAQDVAVEIAAFGQRVRELAALLKDSQRARVWTVMLAEPLPDRETQRLRKELAGLGMARGPLLVNRVLLAADVGTCSRCRRARQWQLATLAGLRRGNDLADIYVLKNFAAEIAGKQGLRKLTAKLWQPA
ncbi:MAG TPA: TRC40/GET3/ArsA family transport-energizing ATPase [Terriglobales bacterium]|nr:TRC40/GET3/ArsA family transport-energizing ATPase [Terriglobales bacterium]